MSSPAPESTSDSSAPRRIGLRDIARSLDVSLMTVSLALRNSPKVSKATRLKVRRMADELGYRPDPEIARLMTRLHKTTQAWDRPPMAIVDLSATRLPSGADNYCEYVRVGAVKRAESLGYLATCFHLLDYEGDLRRLLKVLHYRGIRGILLLPPLSPVELPPGLDWSPFSVIAASYAITPLQFHRVVPHQFYDMSRLIRLLQAKGRQRIGAVFERGLEERTQFHFTAAIKLYDHHENLLRVSDFSNLSLVEIADWLRKCHPDAVITTAAQKLQEAILASNYRGSLPEIVSLGAFKNSPFACWDQRPAEIGSDAALLLAGMMRHNETGVPDSPRTSMVQGAFNDAVAAPAPKPAAAPAPAPAPAKRSRAAKR